MSMAKNYRNSGMDEEASRCLKKIIATYPDSEWAGKAREELKQLGQ